MSHQALLFCPDEKTVRVVTQILSDLDFRVDPSNEPFAAVKKLMAQHFDAVVVDCENEQNAALLFKSARNSSTNQSSLSVAVVEGQAGVAKAFRLGANLVLTKPINVEQAKGTLRVARGLLRKTDPAKAAAPAAPASGLFTSQPMPSSAKPVPPSFSPAPTFTPAPPKVFTPAPAPPQMMPPAAAASSAFEVEAEPAPEPTPADAALLESMPATLPAPTAAVPKQTPWQPVPRPLAPREPVPTKSAPLELTLGGAPKVREGRPQMGTVPSAQSATAPAPAKEPAWPVAKPLDLKPAAAPKREEVSAPHPTKRLSLTEPIVSETPVGHAPTFGMTAEPEGSGIGKKVAIAAVVLIALGAAGYYGMGKFKGGPAQPQAQVATAVPPQTQVPASATPGATTASTTNPAATAQPDTSTTARAAKPTAQKPQETASGRPIPAQPAPMMVRGGSTPETRSAPAENVQAPSLTGIGGDTQGLSGIVNTSVAVPRQGTATPQQTLRISQGVSQTRITKRVQPVYPPRARQMRIQGTVEMLATVSKDGSVTNVVAQKGDSTLASAAIAAVKQWKYQPYTLNGTPIEFQTQVTIDFKLPN